MKRSLLCLLASFLLGAIIWDQITIHKVLFVCTDPVIVFDMFPPFVHGAAVGDYYVVSQQVVYLIYTAFLAGMFGFAYLLDRVVDLFYPRRKEDRG